MKCIQLTRGQVAIVDDEDFECLAQWRWHCSAKGYAKRTAYPVSSYKPVTIWMAREICKPRKGFQVDHINGNRLDNRRCNLREANLQQQNWNTAARKTNALGVKGVHFSFGKYCARIWDGSRNRFIGSFSTLDQAKTAYNMAAIELRGTFARLN